MVEEVLEAVPLAPVTPVAPALPVAPDTPSMPSLPVLPSMPEMPVAPALPVAPDMPSAPARPVDPVAPVMPDAPVAPALPVAPVDPASDPASPAYFRQTVGDRVLFAVDQSTLSPEARATLDGQAAWLLANPDYLAVIEGHADEQGTREYNVALGARRASAWKVGGRGGSQKSCFRS